MNGALAVDFEDDFFSDIGLRLKFHTKTSIIGGLTIRRSWPYFYFVMMPVNICYSPFRSASRLPLVRKLMRE
jgi:hypothetical protein